MSEWRLLRAGAATGTKVERARAEERRWELDVAMIADFGLTLPSEVELHNESRRDDHLGWRRNALRQARRGCARAERLMLLRRVLTLNLWRK